MGSNDTLGFASQIKVQIFGGRSSEATLQQEIHAWLSDNAGAQVQEIQYRYDVDNNIGWYSALIVYR